MSGMRKSLWFVCVLFTLGDGIAGDVGSAPQRIFSGEKSQTKTYMHQFVDSPNGRSYAFRYFPGAVQPRAAKGPHASGRPCEIWTCRSDLTGHQKAFDSPKYETGHGSDVIVWVTDEILYYAGICYDLRLKKERWRFAGKEAHLPLAKDGPVHPHKMYVSVRGDGRVVADAKSQGAASLPSKGWYWIDPLSATLPKLHLVCDMKSLVAHYGGDWENAEATYISPSPDDRYLHVVVYDRKRAQEYGFILHAHDGSFFHDLGPNDKGRCSNGHVLWYDRATLMAGNQHAALFDCKGKVLRRIAPPKQGNHLSLSPDKQWWVGDSDDRQEVRLYRMGSQESVVISGDVVYDNHHPSFSRDGRYVFFQGKRPHERHMGVYRVDIRSHQQSLLKKISASVPR
jgi:hypothetical protein